MPRSPGSSRRLLLHVSRPSESLAPPPWPCRSRAATSRRRAPAPARTTRRPPRRGSQRPLGYAPR
uniref:Uncharacterized protein n=1 Tax=Arundo donax TaxID=35708 RepID=A0A0A9I0K1_ARUDO